MEERRVGVILARNKIGRILFSRSVIGISGSILAFLGGYEIFKYFLQDSDNDGVIDRVESEWGTNPHVPNLNFYASKKGLSKEFLEYLKMVDENENGRKFVDSISKTLKVYGDIKAVEDKLLSLTRKATQDHKISGEEIKEISDLDHDGIPNWDEKIYGGDPLRKNPLIALALERGLAPEVVKLLGKVDKDEKIDENELKFLNALIWIDTNLIPPYIKSHYYSKTLENLSTVESKFSLIVGGKPWLEAFPIDKATYELLNYLKSLPGGNEITALQYKLASSILADGKISNLEIKAIEKLYEERWYVARDIIDSGMINDKNLFEDWDMDGLTNISEILQGINPLNELEKDPNNLSERYAVLVSTCGTVIDVAEVLGVYHLLKRNGYTDDKIFLFFYLDPDSDESQIDTNKGLKGLDWIQWLKGNLLHSYKVEVDFRDEEVTRENFLNTIKNLGCDSNDIIFIFYTGHGIGPLGRIGEVSRIVLPEDLNKTLSSLEYGRLIFVNICCSAESYFKRLNYPYQLKDTIAIAACSVKEDTGGALTTAIFPLLMKGDSLKEAFEKGKTWVTECDEHQHPVVYYFDNKNKECNWWDSFSIIKYLKKR